MRPVDPRLHLGVCLHEHRQDAPLLAAVPGRVEPSTTLHARENDAEPVAGVVARGALDCNLNHGLRLLVGKNKLALASLEVPPRQGSVPLRVVPQPHLAARAVFPLDPHPRCALLGVLRDRDRVLADVRAEGDDAGVVVVNDGDRGLLAAWSDLRDCAPLDPGVGEPKVKALVNLEGIVVDDGDRDLLLLLPRRKQQPTLDMFIIGAGARCAWHRREIHPA
mmetsp:Transcript_88339/g.254746  ORF Transcript_88339/g.254746 Transcript_88339/m.254746 type:complete len:221 (-) Transcript_88339:325-987(-)